MLSFLDINGIHLSYTDEDLIDLGLGVASGKYDAEDILNWITSHE